MIKNIFALIGALALFAFAIDILETRRLANVTKTQLEDQLAKCQAQNEARATYVDSLSRCCWVQSRDGGEVYLQVPRVLP